MGGMAISTASNLPSDLKTLRESRRMTRKQAAYCADVGERSIWYWETGIVNPSLRQIVKLAFAFNVDAADLFRCLVKRHEAEIQSDLAKLKTREHIRNEN